MRSILFLLMAIITVSAADYSRTSVQYLEGDGFDDLIGGDRADGKLKTVTLEHFSTWGYGDNFFFVDSYQGKFDHFGTPKEYLLYMEWSPRLSLSKVSGLEISGGIVKDTYLAAQLNRGDDFSAELYGIGADLELPFFAVFGISYYHRKDNFDNETNQLSINWLLPMGPLSFEGFLDKTDDDLIAQPQLLLDLHTVGLEQDKLYAGVELYYYETDRVNVARPQWMVKWVW